MSEFTEDNDPIIINHYCFTSSKQLDLLQIVQSVVPGVFHLPQFNYFENSSGKDQIVEMLVYFNTTPVAWFLVAYS